MRKLNIERTKKGYPAFWESGGGSSNTGEAFIIAGKDGQPKKAIYVRRRGQLALCSHALIPIEVGDYIIYANHHRKDFEISVYSITEILKEEASIEKIAEFSNGEWDNLPQFLEDAVEAVMEKATCYHCREPHYIA